MPLQSVPRFPNARSGVTVIGLPPFLLPPRDSVSGRTSSVCRIGWLSRRSDGSTVPRGGVLRHGARLASRGVTDEHTDQSGGTGGEQILDPDLPILDAYHHLWID